MTTTAAKSLLDLNAAETIILLRTQRVNDRIVLAVEDGEYNGADLFRPDSVDAVIAAAFDTETKQQFKIKPLHLDNFRVIWAALKQAENQGSSGSAPPAAAAAAAAESAPPTAAAAAAVPKRALKKRKKTVKEQPAYPDDADGAVIIDDDDVCKEAPVPKLPPPPPRPSTSASRSSNIGNDDDDDDSAALPLAPPAPRSLRKPASAAATAAAEEKFRALEQQLQLAKKFNEALKQLQSDSQSRRQLTSNEERNNRKRLSDYERRDNVSVLERLANALRIRFSQQRRDLEGDEQRTRRQVVTDSDKLLRRMLDYEAGRRLHIPRVELEYLSHSLRQKIIADDYAQRQLLHAAFSAELAATQQRQADREKNEIQVVVSDSSSSYQVTLDCCIHDTVDDVKQVAFNSLFPDLPDEAAQRYVLVSNANDEQAMELVYRGELALYAAGISDNAQLQLFPLQVVVHVQATGKELRLDCNHSDNMYIIKQRIQHDVGVPPERQRFMTEPTPCGAELSDALTLAECTGYFSTSHLEVHVYVFPRPKVKPTVVKEQHEVSGFYVLIDRWCKDIVICQPDDFVGDVRVALHDAAPRCLVHGLRRLHDGDTLQQLGISSGTLLTDEKKQMQQQHELAIQEERARASITQEETAVRGSINELNAFHVLVDIGCREPVRLACEPTDSVFDVRAALNAKAAPNAKWVRCLVHGLRRLDDGDTLQQLGISRGTLLADGTKQMQQEHELAIEEEKERASMNELYPAWKKEQSFHVLVDIGCREPVRLACEPTDSVGHVRAALNAKWVRCLVHGCRRLHDGDTLRQLGISRGTLLTDDEPYKIFVEIPARRASLELTVRGRMTVDELREQINEHEPVQEQQRVYKGSIILPPGRTLGSCLVFERAVVKLL